MRTTRISSLLATAALIPALAPAASSARPIDERPAGTGCYQLDQYVPGQARGVHRVLCGADAPAPVHDRTTVATLHSRGSRNAGALGLLALAVAVTGLAVSAATVVPRRQGVGGA